MMAIFPRKYQRPRYRGISGLSGCGRPGFVAPNNRQQTAVQQPFTLHTPSGGRRIGVRFATFCMDLVSF